MGSGLVLVLEVGAKYTASGRTPNIQVGIGVRIYVLIDLLIIIKF